MLVRMSFVRAVRAAVPSVYAFCCSVFGRLCFKQGVLCRRSAYYVVLTARGVLLAECACGVREAWRAPGPVPWARHERVMKAGAALLLSCHGLLCAMGIGWSGDADDGVTTLWTDNRR
ncbi:hypothetical protein HPB47_028308 [Ixodes persulcatus]|uniref:Uncharacterized protein n=1 Tax=Ixodes persulcatus TaxID=34615 RepID=A0AC60PV29_IXOPE|nr:hypothetical protein HPB47_028308 [Ixodes persulcatus]